MPLDTVEPRVGQVVINGSLTLFIIMKKELFFLSSLALMTLASCSNDENDTIVGNPSYEIRVATEVTTPQTRAGYTTETLREFGLIVASGNEAFTYNNKRMTGGPLNGWTTDETMYWAGANQAHTVIAYAPYRDTSLDQQSKIDVKVETDQSTADAVTASDFIAMKNGAFTPSTDLTDGKLLVKMDHMFAKVFVKLTYPEAYATDDGSNPVTEMSVEGMKTDATFDFDAWDGSDASTALGLNGNGTTEAITPYELSHDAENRVVTYEFISVPQETATISIKFRAGGTPYTWTYENLTQNSGEALTITLSVDKQGVQLGDEVTVGDWTVGDEINGGQPSEGADPYTIEEITTGKSEWSIEYASASMAFGPLSQAFDNSLNASEGWFSQVVDGYDNSPNTGSPFAVIDLGTSTWFAGVGILTSYHDVMPKAVDFYITSQEVIENMITEQELSQVLCTAEPNGDTWVNTADYTTYLEKVKAADADISWTHIGKVEIGALSAEYGQKEYRIDFDETKLAQELKSRYLKVVVTFFSAEEYAVLRGDRAKISEIFVKKVTAQNGVAVE